MSKIKSYWFAKEKNFGDLLTPFLLRKYGFVLENCPIDQSDVLVVGSILQDLTQPYTGYVLGSGLIDDRRIDLSLSTVLALRGELTKSRTNTRGEILLADPGLLLPNFLEKRLEKEFILGIVPHYVDKLDPRVQLIASRYKDDILLIDVQREPLEVASDLDRCYSVVSSSLHGIIVADALGIPNTWILLSQKVLGEGYKFYDYFSSFGVTRKPKMITGTERLSELVKTDQPDMAKVRKKQQSLELCFRQLAAHFDKL